MSREHLIRKMTVLNPNERIDIKEVLQIMISDICPISMTQMLIHMNNLITTSVYWKPDIIIGLIYKHWRQIWKMTFGLNEKAPLLYQKLNFYIINKLTLSNLFKDIKGDIQKNKEENLNLRSLEIRKRENEFNIKMNFLDDREIQIENESQNIENAN